MLCVSYSYLSIERTFPRLGASRCSSNEANVASGNRIRAL